MISTRRSLLRYSGLAVLGVPVLSALGIVGAGPELAQSEREAARRAGVPLSPQELPHPKITSGENAGPQLKELTRNYKELVTRDKQGLLSLAEVALERPHCDLAYNWSIGHDLTFPELGTAHRLAQLFCERATKAATSESAWIDIENAARLGNWMAETPCLSAALVSSTIHSMAHQGYLKALRRFGLSTSSFRVRAAFAPPPSPEYYLSGEAVMSMVLVQRIRRQGLEIQVCGGGGEAATLRDAGRLLHQISPVAVPYWERQLVRFWREAFEQAHRAKVTGNYAPLETWFKQALQQWEAESLWGAQNLLVTILAPGLSDAIHRIHIQSLAQKHERETEQSATRSR